MFIPKFCAGFKKFARSGWIQRQSRSYFAIELPHKWWIFGIDTQHFNDIDQPQDEYFRNVVKHYFKGNEKIIICSAVPSWLDSDTNKKRNNDFKRGIDHVATAIIKNEFQKKQKPNNPDARETEKNEANFPKIHAVISGDEHFYCHYKSTEKKDGTHFIISGGGGAYLSSTQYLQKDIDDLNWYDQKKVFLRLQNLFSDSTKRASYPGKEKKLKKSNRIFRSSSLTGFFSIFFFLTLYICIYWLSTNSINLNTWLLLPLFLIFVTLPCFCFVKYISDSKKCNNTKILFFLFINLIFFALFYATICISQTIVNCFNNSSEAILLLVLTTPLIIIISIILGLISEFIIKLSIWLASTNQKEYGDTLFSLLQLEDYKNFLRMHVTKDGLTIYVIGIDKIIPRNKLKINTPTNTQPGYEPENDDLKPTIVDTIVIKVNSRD